MKLRVFVFVLTVCSIFQGFSQDRYFQRIDNTHYDSAKAQIVSRHYALFAFQNDKILEVLKSAPSCEFWEQCAFPTLEIPSPDGEVFTFVIACSGVMPEEMKNEFTDIRAVRGYTIFGSSTLYLKAEIGPKGFTAMVTGHPSGTWFIDPLYRNLPEVSICYFKKDFQTEKQFVCHVSGSPLEYEHEEYFKTQNNVIIVEKVRREYRLAVTTTGEYSQFHGGTIPMVMNAIITTINRVNSVYERDIAIRLVLVPNNSSLIFLDAATDPFQNNNASQLLSSNPGVINNAIGFNAYDIGHNFSTGGGGLASLACVCQSSKAQGVTGSSAPIGDPFDIDYVAHEIGHQFGANHTQNNSCQRNGATAWEPGSASTIMGYAGICPPNLQNNSDDYFHTGSIGEMRNFAILGSGNSCANRINTPNSAPLVDSIRLPNTTIPRETPFKLEGFGSDADGDPILYTWEQFDIGPSGAPNNPSGNAPIFRSFPPVPSGTRFFPRYASVLTGINVIGEILPTYGRNLRFRLTLRDGSAVSFQQILLTVDASAGPFSVTYPTQGAVMRSGTLTRITWNVASTDAGNINCKEVDIYLSTDNGSTWSHYLGRRPNNGEALVILPPGLSTSAARIRIDGVNQLFFSISRFFSLTPSVLSAEEYNPFRTASIFPNPTACGSRAHFLFESQVSGKCTIHISTVDGKVVYTRSLHLPVGINTIDLPSDQLKAGMYIVHVKSAEGSGTYRWMVQ
ncbi:MAG: reprolysin-like metallopeptidase [Thermaurantimonas sp.]